MKRISTLLLTFSIAAVSWAAPRAYTPANGLSLPTKAERKASPAAPAWVEDIRRTAAPASLPAYRKAADPQNPMGTVSFNEIVGDSLTYEATYYPGYKAWYIMFSDGRDTPTNYITIGIANNGEEPLGEYTLGDCVPSWTGTNLSNDSIELTRVLFDSVQLSFARTATGLQIDGRFHVDSVGYVTVSYFKLLPKDTVTLIVPAADLQTDKTAWQVTGATADKQYLASVGVSATKIVGSYAAKQIDRANTFVATTSGTDTIYHTIYGDRASVVGAVEGDNYAIRLEMMGQDTLWYDVTFLKALPEVKDTVDIVATNLSIDAAFASTMGIVFISASNDDYEVSIMLRSSVEPNGTFTAKDFQSSYLVQGQEAVSFIGGSVVIDYTEKTLAGYLLGDDMTRYRLDLSFVIPTATDTVEVAFSDIQPLVFDYETGLYTTYHANSEIGMQLGFLGDPTNPAGTYTMYGDEDIDNYYTFVEIPMEGEEEGMRLETLDATLVITETESDNLYAVTATLLSEDLIAYVFTFNAFYKYVEGALNYDTPIGDLSKTYTQADIAVFAADEWKSANRIYFQALGINDLRMLNLEFNTKAGEAVIQGDTMPVAGVYPINYSTEPNSVTASEGIILYDEENAALTGSYTGILTRDMQMSTTGLYFLVAGTVTVSYNESGQVKIEVTAKNSYDLDVHIVYDAAASAVSEVRPDSTTGVQKMLYNGQLLIRHGNKTYTLMGVEVR